MARIDLKKNTNVAEYRHRITIQRKVGEDIDSKGFVSEVWETVYEPRAKVARKPGKEYVESNVTPYTRKVMHFWFRTHPKIRLDESMRVLYDGIVWEIRTVDDVNDNLTITYLICEVGE